MIMSFLRILLVLLLTVDASATLRGRGTASASEVITSPKPAPTHEGGAKPPALFQCPIDGPMSTTSRGACQRDSESFMASTATACPYNFVRVGNEDVPSIVCRPCGAIKSSRLERHTAWYCGVAPEYLQAMTAISR